MLKIEELKIESHYKRLTPESKEQFKALEKLIVNDAEIHSPIIVWKDHKIVADGHCRVEIIRKHPELKYTIREIEFGDWQDVQVWIVEHHIARNSFTLWQKLEMAMNCVEYWEAKEQARRSQGTRNDLNTPSVKKSDPIDTKAIMAEKVGCGTTTVSQFLKVFESPKDGIKQRCREGDMSIKRAYESLTKKKKGNDKSNGKKGDKPLVIEFKKNDMLRDIEKNQDLGKKSNIKIPDPKPVATKMGTANTSEGSVWFSINPIAGVIQIFRKSTDQKKGGIHVGINNYSCKAISQEDGVTILEACHIDGSAEEVSQKDDVDFEKTKKVS